MKPFSELPIDEAFLTEYYFVKKDGVYVCTQFGRDMVYNPITGLLINFKGQSLMPVNQLQFAVYYQRLWDEVNTVL